MSPPAADRRARFYRFLALGLTLGVAAAFLLGYGGITGPGWLTPDEAILSLGTALVVAALVLGILLLRMVSVFDFIDQLRARTLEESRQAEAARQKVVLELEALQQAVRADLEGAGRERERQGWGLQEAVRREVETAQGLFAAKLRSGWEADTANLKGLFERSQKETDSRLRTAEASLKRATEAAEERAGMDLTASQRRDHIVMQKEAEVTNQVKELQAAAATLQRAVKALDARVGTALDALERREMEEAAGRTKLERDLADVRKRAELLVIKNRELEEAVEGPPSVARITHRDVKGHVLSLEAIEPQHAQALANVGIRNVEQLATSDALDLARRVQAQGVKISEATVNRWIQAARAKGVG